MTNIRIQETMDNTNKSIKKTFFRDTPFLKSFPKILLKSIKIVNIRKIKIVFSINLFKKKKKNDLFLSSSNCSLLPIQKIVEKYKKNEIINKTIKFIIL